MEKIYFRIYSLVFIILGLMSFLTYGKAHILSMGLVLNILIVLGVLIYGRKVKKELKIYLFLLLIYITLSAVYSVILKNDNILDFLMAYKVFFYLTILILLVGMDFKVETKYFILFYYILLALFLIKYAVSVGLELNFRPILYRENNFELLFLSLVFYLKFLLIGKIKLLEWIVIIMIFLLSMSKSGIALFLVVAFVIQTNKITIKSILIFLPIILVILIFLINIISIKMNGKGIDRIVFASVFFEEMYNANWWNSLVGMERITPLSSYSCDRLSYYKQLFSYKENGECYSVILHSFNLRIIMDHGLIGLVAVVLITSKALIVSNYSRYSSVIFNLILLLNGLSVSSYNGYFFLLSAILFLGFSKNLMLEHRYNYNKRNLK